MPERISYATWLLWLGFGAMGGAARYLSLSLKGEIPQVVTKNLVMWFAIRLVGSAFFSAFCGLMGGLFVSQFTDSASALLLAAGMFGNIGDKGLDHIASVLKNRYSK